MEIYQQRSYWPTVDWEEAKPQEMNIDPALLSRIQAHINEHVPGLHGLLIVRHGYLVFEEYYQGFHRQSYNSISSATKSVISMLGKAIMDLIPDFILPAIKEIK